MSIYTVYRRTIRKEYFPSSNASLELEASVSYRTFCDANSCTSSSIELSKSLALFRASGDSNAFNAFAFCSAKAVKTCFSRFFASASIDSFTDVHAQNVNSAMPHTHSINNLQIILFLIPICLYTLFRRGTLSSRRPSTYALAGLPRMIYGYCQTELTHDFISGFNNDVLIRKQIFKS